MATAPFTHTTRIDDISPPSPRCFKADSAALDVYRPATRGPHPTLLHIHGGGWTGGSREGVVLRSLPYVQMGFAVVNVTYRLARVAPAPAAVEDCLCALRWIAAYAVTWLGSLENRDAVARRVSPLTYVRKELPPVLTIHGDADPVVPYAHGTRLQTALQSAGATSELVTIPKGLHGNFPRAEQLRAIQAVRAFLVKHGVLPTAATSSQ